MSLIKHDTSSSIYSSHKKPTRGFEEQNDAVMWSVKQWQVKLLRTILEILVTASQISQLNWYFSPCCRSAFYLVTFFILCTIVFSLKCIRACQSISFMPLLGVYPFLSSHRISYHSCHGTKSYYGVWSIWMTIKVPLCGN